MTHTFTVNPGHPNNWLPLRKELVELNEVTIVSEIVYHTYFAGSEDLGMGYSRRINKTDQWDFNWEDPMHRVGDSLDGHYWLSVVVGVEDTHNQEEFVQIFKRHGYSLTTPNPLLKEYIDG